MRKGRRQSDSQPTPFNYNRILGGARTVKIIIIRDKSDEHVLDEMVEVFLRFLRRR
tara:strand:- start:367 stop:534 length:168 start_codon:yes stop_codon:yes gene_type:complete